MFVYFLFIFLSLILIFVYDYSGVTRFHRQWVFFEVLYLICLAGFRYRIGTDTVSYMTFYSDYPILLNLSYDNFTTSQAPLWVLFESFLRTVTSEFWIVQFCISAFLVLTVIKTISYFSLSRYTFTILLIFFLGPYFILTCESIRETMAICVFLRSIPYLINKDFKRYYLFSLIAIGFHYGAILLLVIPVVMKIKFNLLSGAICVGAFFFTSIFNKLFVQSSSLFSLMTFYEVYFPHAVDSYNIYSIGSIINLLMIPLFIAYVLRKENGLIKFLLPLLMLKIIINGTAQSIPIFYRYNNYLSILYILVYCYFISYVKTRMKANILNVFVLILIFLPLLYTYSNMWFRELSWYPGHTWSELINPYTSIFDKSFIPEREEIYTIIGKGTL